MNLLLVGLNHSTAPVAVRERVSFEARATSHALRAAARVAGLHEAVLLSTCNRTELYGSSVSDPEGALDRLTLWIAEEAGIDAGEIAQHLYRRRDEEVVTHLYRVAAGLDSLVMGEPQILGQVGGAYDAAHRAGATGARLSRLFQSAVEVGKSVRSNTALGATPVSVATIAIQLARRLLGELSDQRVLVVGAGEMCEIAAVLLAEREPRAIVVVNRTFERAEALGARVGGTAAPWERLTEELASADLIITSTGAPEPVISQDALAAAATERAGERIVVIDMGVPRDVEPACGCMQEVYLYDIDALEQIADEHRAKRQSAVPRAEAIVEEARRRYLKWQETLAVVPTVVSLRQHFDEIRAAEVRQHLAKIQGIDAAGEHRIEQLTQAIVNKILHEPVSRLKRRAGDGMGVVLAGSLRYLFDLDDLDEES